MHDPYIHGKFTWGLIFYNKWTEKMRLPEVYHYFFQVNTVECGKYNSPVMACTV